MTFIELEEWCARNNFVLLRKRDGTHLELQAEFPNGMKTRMSSSIEKEDSAYVDFKSILEKRMNDK